MTDEKSWEPDWGIIMDIGDPGGYHRKESVSTCTMRVIQEYHRQLIAGPIAEIQDLTGALKHVHNILETLSEAILINTEKLKLAEIKSDPSPKTIHLGKTKSVQDY